MKPTLPHRAGVSLKPQHYQEIISTLPDIGWFEVHPENYMGAGGPPHRYLQKIREHYALSFHGVGMSLGSTGGIKKDHLIALKHLIDRYQPAQVSEHIAWSHCNQIFLNDLLPLPYTHDSLEILCENLDRMQSFLGQAILVENPSTYIDFSQSDFSEPEFINRICKKTGAGLLLDVNNIYVSASNNGFDPYRYIDDIKLQNIGEIHLAGHSEQKLGNNKTIRIDDHGSEVKKNVWALYDYLLSKTKQPLPTLIEWDNNVPSLTTLLGEAEKADTKLNNHSKNTTPCI
ncbi:DUF692 domain-containing protein [Teredinibacter haidensis]|uniref:MNIO family bufferin maturase n=1 Tax=Teredinibacter haidensis TaxID=2731755 RepID=UPI000948E444|nr:DUF692 domain-containing protein [Teredinibacter haidensis]